ncbi:hypothetical protein Tco_1485386 [Tanacetum coccineum]
MCMSSSPWGNLIACAITRITITRTTAKIYQLSGGRITASGASDGSDRNLQLIFKKAERSVQPRKPRWFLNVFLQNLHHSVELPWLLVIAAPILVGATGNCNKSTIGALLQWYHSVPSWVPSGNAKTGEDMIEYLGHIISENDVASDPNNIKAPFIQISCILVKEAYWFIVPEATLSNTHSHQSSPKTPLKLLESRTSKRHYAMFVEWLVQWMDEA